MFVYILIRPDVWFSCSENIEEGVGSGLESGLWSVVLLGVCIYLGL